MYTDEFTVEFLPKSCQWLDSSNDKCGKPTQVKRSYCAEHHSKAYKKTTEDEIDSAVKNELKSLDKSEVEWQEDSD